MRMTTMSTKRKKTVTNMRVRLGLPRKAKHNVERDFGVACVCACVNISFSLASSRTGVSVVCSILPLTGEW